MFKPIEELPEDTPDKYTISPAVKPWEIADENWPAGEADPLVVNDLRSFGGNTINASVLPDLIEVPSTAVAAVSYAMPPTVAENLNELVEGVTLKT